MKILVISGFLGSGKTSLLLELVERLRKGGGKRVAVVENEIGEIGIDGRRLGGSGLEVREIIGGCICCQLKGSLRAALEEIERALFADCVIVEASGLALLGDVLLDLHESVSGVSPRAVYMVDVERLGGRLADAPPFITGQLQYADLVLLNKVDTVGIAAQATLMSEASAVSPAAMVKCLSLTEGTGMDAALETIASWV